MNREVMDSEAENVAERGADYVKERHLPTRVGVVTDIQSGDLAGGAAMKIRVSGGSVSTTGGLARRAAVSVRQHSPHGS